MPGAVEHVAGLTPQPAPTWLDGWEETLRAHHEPLGFSVDEYRTRHGRVVAAMAAAGVDLLLVTRVSTVDWLTGFSSVARFPLCAVVDVYGVTLCLPVSEVGRAVVASTADAVRYFGGGAPFEQIADHIATRSTFAVGVDHGSDATPAALVRALESRGIALRDTGQLVERLRLVLSPAERERLREAARGTAAGLDAALAAAAEPDATDSGVAAAALAALTRDAGSLARGNLAVATDWRGGVTHSTWNGTPLGPCTFLEFSGGSHRYAAPVMRTVLRGPASTTVRQLDAHARAGLEATLGGLRAGVTADEVARQAEEAVGALASDVVFHFNFGYPIGVGQVTTWLDGADFFIVRGNHEPLAAGMAFHIPMSFRSVGRAGVGHSQTVVVTADGAEVVTAGVTPLGLIRVR